MKLYIYNIIQDEAGFTLGEMMRAAENEDAAWVEVLKDFPNAFRYKPDYILELKDENPGWLGCIRKYPDPYKY